MSDKSRVLSGRYRVDDIIGRGGMAIVYRGYDLKLGRDVAIKILDRELAKDNVFRTRFRMEAQAASRMSHSAIVRVFDAGEDKTETGEAKPFIVMELVSGRTLKDVITDGPVPLTDALRYTDGILEALEYSHRAGVVHRDIKPGNIMITTDGRVKVMDFGIARAVSDSSSTVAETTTIIGTAAYFSPEQAKGEPVDARTDLYSTGVVLFELLAGRQPFRGDTPVAVAYQHVSETPATPSEIVSTVPRALDAVVLKALAKDPFSRFPDAATFRAALAGAGEGRAPSKRQLENLTNELYGANPRAAAETARSLRQLSTDTTMTRTQQGPPVAWIWAGVAVVAVLIVSIVFWVMSLGSMRTPETSPTAPTITDVSDWGKDRALDELTALGLEPRTLEEASSTVTAGNVIRTDPAAGEQFKPGDKIQVFVSSGLQTAVVPLLVSTDIEAAKKAITTANFVVGRISPKNDPTAKAGTVLSASVDGKEVDSTQELPVNTVIDLVVATGKVTISDYTGSTVESATAALQGDQFQLIVVPVPEYGCEESKINNPPTVSSQSVVGDVAVGSEVSLYYCAAE